MAKRGDQAREAVKNKIIEAFGNDFLLFQDKKIYVQAQDGTNGEVIQFAITMTMPKTPVEMSNNSNSESSSSSPSSAATEISEEDQAKIKALMEKLGVKTT